MKRTTATAAALGVMVLVFSVPVVLLFRGGAFLILNGPADDLGAGSWGLAFNLSKSYAGMALIILMLASLVSWLTQKILRHKNSRR